LPKRKDSNDPEIILNYLRSNYSDEIEMATFDTSGFDSIEKTTAFRFSSIHLRVQAEKRQKVQESEVGDFQSTGEHRNNQQTRNNDRPSESQ